MDGTFGVKRASAVAAGVAAFALVPILLIQFTILASLLAVAGLMPLVRGVILHDAVGPAMWGIALACMTLSLMIRPEMTAAVIVVCAPALVFSFLWDRDWRPAVLVCSFVVGVSLLAFGLQYLNQYEYTASRPHARLLEYNRLLAYYVEYTGGRSYQRSVYSLAGWSANDMEMVSGFMGLDAGPFRLEALRRAAEEREKALGMAPVISHADHDRMVAPRRLWILGKFERLVRDRRGKDVLRSMYLAVVLGAGFSLLVAVGLLGDWRRFLVLAGTGSAVIAGYVVTILVIDRPVFRVLFPMAYIFLTLALAVFPWRRLRDCDLSNWRLFALWSAIGVFSVMGGVGIAAAVGQAYSNREQQRLFAEFLQKVALKAEAHGALVAWPDALPLQYQSPFVNYEATRGEVPAPRRLQSIS